MATSEITSSTSPTLNRWGQPCAVAQAFERFEGPVEDARRCGETDALLHHLARDLIKICDRLGRSHLALEFFRDGVDSQNEADRDRVVAVLDQQTAYELESCNLAFKMAGEVLVALERADLASAFGVGRTA